MRLPREAAAIPGEPDDDGNDGHEAECLGEEDPHGEDAAAGRRR